MTEDQQYDSIFSDPDEIDHISANFVLAREGGPGTGYVDASYVVHGKDGRTETWAGRLPNDLAAGIAFVMLDVSGELRVNPPVITTPEVV